MAAITSYNDPYEGELRRRRPYVESQMESTEVKVNQESLNWLFGYLPNPIHPNLMNLENVAPELDRMGDKLATWLFGKLCFRPIVLRPRWRWCEGLPPFFKSQFFCGSAISGDNFKTQKIILNFVGDEKSS